MILAAINVVVYGFALLGGLTIRRNYHVHRE